MEKGKKGLLTSSGEWAKHLRPFQKKKFWKSERQAQKRLEKLEINSMVK